MELEAPAPNDPSRARLFHFRALLGPGHPSEYGQPIASVVRGARSRLEYGMEIHADLQVDVENAYRDLLITGLSFAELMADSQFGLWEDREAFSRRLNELEAELLDLWTEYHQLVSRLMRSAAGVAVASLRAKAAQCALRAAAADLNCRYAVRLAAFVAMVALEADDEHANDTPAPRALAPPGRTITAVPIVSHAPPLSRVSAAA